MERNHLHRDLAVAVEAALIRWRRATQKLALASAGALAGTAMLAGVAAADMNITLQTYDLTRFIDGPYGALMSTEGSEIMGLQVPGCSVASGLQTAAKVATAGNASAAAAGASAANAIRCGGVSAAQVIDSVASGVNGGFTGGTDSLTVVSYRRF